MTERTQGAPELEVTNFGPIAKARVDLRPLTVFIGPSNTGKSYLAILIYALHRFFGGNAGNIPIGSSPPIGYRISGSSRRRTLPRNAMKAFEKMAQNFMDNQNPGEEKGIILPAPILRFVRSGMEGQGEFLSQEINRCFGVGKINEWIRKDQNHARIVLRQCTSDDSEPFENMMTFTARNTECKMTSPEKVSIQETEEVDEIFWRAKEEDHLVFSNFTDFLGRIVLPHLAGSLHSPAFYLPADRAGVMHAHSVMVRALIGSATMAGLRPAAQTPMLSGILADFLEQLIVIDRPPYRRRTSRRDLGSGIEKTILSGSVRVERAEATNYPRFTYRPDGWKDDLPLMNASSMVSELAPVVLYLRHTVRPGDVLIVEEPESHLHPAMQVEFTHQLATLVEAGIRIIITTHSEWLLEKLANIVRRSELPERKRDGNSGTSVTLHPDQVSAWRFDPKRRPKGTVVKEICLDESGLYPSGFDDVARQLHNDWASIPEPDKNN